jgi:hypothetical protein
MEIRPNSCDILVPSFPGALGPGHTTVIDGEIEIATFGWKGRLLRVRPLLAISARESVRHDIKECCNWDVQRGERLECLGRRMLE